MAFLVTFLRFLYITESYLQDWRLLTKSTAKKYEWWLLNTPVIKCPLYCFTADVVYIFIHASTFRANFSAKKHLSWLKWSWGGYQSNFFRTKSDCILSSRHLRAQTVNSTHFSHCAPLGKNFPETIPQVSFRHPTQLSALPQSLATLPFPNAVTVSSTMPWYELSVHH